MGQGLAGLAKQPVVFLDEVGKASSQVVNMTLDAMEERLVSTPTHDRSISLHTLVGASNETLADDSAAAWDRFAIRVRVRRLDESSKVVSMWTRNRGKRQAPEETRPAATPVGITTDELKAMRSMVAWMAENVSDAVCEMGAQMWSGIQAQQTLRVSDRRWERLMQVAAGRALIPGRTEVLPEDLTVARHMLWESVDSIDAVAKFVQSIVDTETTEIQAFDRMIGELEAMAAKATDVDTKARTLYRAGQQKRQIGARQGRSDWDKLRARIAAIEELVSL